MEVGLEQVNLALVEFLNEGHSSLAFEIRVDNLKHFFLFFGDGNSLFEFGKPF